MCLELTFQHVNLFAFKCLTLACNIWLVWHVFNYFEWKLDFYRFLKIIILGYFLVIYWSLCKHLPFPISPTCMSAQFFLFVGIFHSGPTPCYSSQTQHLSNRRRNYEKLILLTSDTIASLTWGFVWRLNGGVVDRSPCCRVPPPKKNHITTHYENSWTSEAKLRLQIGSLLNTSSSNLA